MVCRASVPRRGTKAGASAPTWARHRGHIPRVAAAAGALRNTLSACLADIPINQSFWSINFSRCGWVFPPLQAELCSGRLLSYIFRIQCALCGC